MQHIVIDPGGAMQSAGLAFIVPDTREAIELAVEAMIERLDAMTGDPDLEHDPCNEGEPAFSAADQAECNRYRVFNGGGAGCVLSDPPEEDDHSGCYPDEDEPIGCPTQAAPSGPGCPISDPAEMFAIGAEL